MKKIIIGLIFTTTIIILGFLIFSKETEEQAVNNKLKVVATIFPNYEITREIGGNRVELLQLLPPGLEAHSFEPKPSDLIKINEADVFIYTSKEMEPWVIDILNGLNNKKLLVVDLSSKVKMISGTHHEHKDEESEEEILDPHIWLDFDNYQLMAQQVSEALVIKDPENKNLYTENLNTLNTKITLLNQKYQEILSNCEKNKIIYGGHYAFGYMTAKYQLNYEAAQGFSPDSEPSAKDLKSLIDQIRREGLNYVYYEEMSTPKIAEIISQETGVGLLQLNAAHNVTKEQVQNKISFISIMENNLNNLKLGLNCK